jgi:hypothetical protein
VVSRRSEEPTSRRAREKSQVTTDAQWQEHPTVNSPNPCPWCGIRALHEQHCKQICLACGWYQSCVD